MSEEVQRIGERGQKSPLELPKEKIQPASCNLILNISSDLKNHLRISNNNNTIIDIL